MALILLQARLNSSRLPEKALLPILPGKRIIDVCLSRLRRTGHKIVLCAPQNQGFGEVALEHGVLLHEGSEDDVLARLHDAALRYGKGESTVVRITADCPLVCTSLVLGAVHDFNASDYDYMSNAHPNRVATRGFDIEVFSKTLLTVSHYFACGPGEREHVTPFMYSGTLPGCRFGTLPSSERLYFTDENLSVDTEEDYERVRKIYETIGNDMFEWSEVMRLYAN